MQKKKLVGLVMAMFISLAVSSANAQPITGTAILRDAEGGSHAPLSYYLALPKGVCNIVIAGSFGYDSVREENFRLDVAQAGITGTPQNLQVCYAGTSSTGYYMYNFKCAATVTITDNLPFLYITYFNEKYSGYLPFRYGTEYRSYGYGISYLSVSYSCQ